MYMISPAHSFMVYVHYGFLTVHRSHSTLSHVATLLTLSTPPKYIQVAAPAFGLTTTTPSQLSLQLILLVDDLLLHLTLLVNGTNIEVLYNE